MMTLAEATQVVVPGTTPGRLACRRGAPAHQRHCTCRVGFRVNSLVSIAFAASRRDRMPNADSIVLRTCHVAGCRMGGDAIGLRPFCAQALLSRRTLCKREAPNSSR